jgi:hypothetical protein
MRRPVRKRGFCQRGQQCGRQRDRSSSQLARGRRTVGRSYPDAALLVGGAASAEQARFRRRTLEVPNATRRAGRPRPISGYTAAARRSCSAVSSTWPNHAARRGMSSASRSIRFRV